MGHKRFPQEDLEIPPWLWDPNFSRSKEKTIKKRVSVFSSYGFCISRELCYSLVTKDRFRNLQQAIYNSLDKVRKLVSLEHSDLEEWGNFSQNLQTNAGKTQNLRSKIA
jgi:hypothetical protein